MTPDLLKAIGLLRRALGRAATTALAGTGVGPRQYVVLRELRRAGPLSQVELARSTVTDPAGMMRVIDALEVRGWVQRKASDQDRRCKIVSLTSQGRRAVDDLDDTYEGLRALADGALSSPERRQFAALAARLAAAFDASSAAVPTPDELASPRSRADGRRAELR